MVTSCRQLTYQPLQLDLCKGLHVWQLLGWFTHHLLSCTGCVFVYCLFVNKPLFHLMFIFVKANVGNKLFLCRAKMEADLKTFVGKKQNLLGGKVESRLADIDQLTKDQNLIMKWFKLTQSQQLCLLLLNLRALKVDIPCLTAMLLIIVYLKHLYRTVLAWQNITTVIVKFKLLLTYYCRHWCTSVCSVLSTLQIYYKEFPQ